MASDASNAGCSPFEDSGRPPVQFAVKIVQLHAKQQYLTHELHDHQAFTSVTLSCTSWHS